MGRRKNYIRPFFTTFKYMKIKSLCRRLFMKAFFCKSGGYAVFANIGCFVGDLAVV